MASGAQKYEKLASRRYSLRCMASTLLPGSPRWAAEKEVEVLRLLVREPAAVVELWLRRQRVVSGAVMRRGPPALAAPSICFSGPRRALVGDEYVRSAD